MLEGYEMVDEKSKIYTIGYGRTRTFLDAKVLMREAIPHEQPILLVDVRYHPHTQWGVPCWNADELRAICKLEANADLTYVWCGAYVGNPKKRAQNTFRMWLLTEQRAQLDSFKNYLYKKLREGFVPVLLCACLKDALTKCHRVPLAAYLREVLGVEVRHL